MNYKVMWQENNIDLATKDVEENPEHYEMSLQEKYDAHDCHKSADDGCETCEDYWTYLGKRDK